MARLGYFDSEPVAVWQLSRAQGGGWKKTNLYVFAGGKDGQNPVAPLVMDATGNLYGSSTYGGGGQAFIKLGYAGCGTVFELMPQKGGGWKEKVLYAFQYQPDGAWPVGGLAIDKSGNLYGMTTAGGTRCNANYYKGCGIVFQLTPHPDGSGSETVIHPFGGTSGINPWGTLVQRFRPTNYFPLIGPHQRKPSDFVALILVAGFYSSGCKMVSRPERRCLTGLGSAAIPGIPAPGCPPLSIRVTPYSSIRA
jgi:hypothetical protein